MDVVIGEIESAIRKSDFGRAVSLAEQLVRQCPLESAPWNALGASLRASAKTTAAVAAYIRSLELRPRNAAALTNLGNALKDLRRFDEAIAAHCRAVSLEPKNPKYHVNVASAYREAGRPADALAALERAIALGANSATVRFDRAQMLLTLGRYQAAWPDFDERRRLKEFRNHALPHPLWDGATLPDKTILLWCEQGFGDTILAARFVRFAKQRVGRVVLECQPELARVFIGIEGVDLIVSGDDALPEFHVHCPLMSLVQLFAQGADQIPAPVQVHVPTASRKRIYPLLQSTGDRLKVGIVWSGSTSFGGNHMRAAEVTRFLEFAAVPRIQLFSLQKGPCAADLAKAGATAIVIDLAPHLNDFGDTAAAVDGLDLVIMTDSSVAHLAGSMGKPIWNLLASNSYWIYRVEEQQTSWYPSMHLFRQTIPGDWTSVFQDVRAALTEMVRSRNTGTTTDMASAASGR